jgi:hypothetical protein
LRIECRENLFVAPSPAMREPYLLSIYPISGDAKAAPPDRPVLRRENIETRCRAERIGKVRTDWICWTSSSVVTPVVEQSNAAAEAAIDCGHSLTRCIVQRAVYFPCGPMAGGNCHEEGLRPVEREEAMRRQPYGPVETKEMRVKADGGRERPEKSRGGR